MPYSPANKFPKSLQASQLSRPDAQNPRLAGPVDAVQITIELTCVPKNYDGTALTGNFLLGISGDGTTETVYCGPGGVSGTTLTVVRGIRPNGIDYTTGDPAFATAHAQDSAVFFDVSAIHYELVSSTLTGLIPTGDNNFRVGDLTATDIKNYYSNDQTDKPYDYYDESAQRPRFHMGDDGPSTGQELEGVIIRGTTAQLNALPELPNLGMVAGDTTLGVTVFREGGVWVPNGSGGSTPNASTTVAGKVQEATQTENDQGTASGSTGARLFAVPGTNAKTIQRAKWIYYFDHTASLNPYVVLLIPALISAYEDGTSFIFGVDATNISGGTTMNISSQGNIPIKKGNYIDLDSGDLVKGQQYAFTINVKQLIFNAVFTGGETSGTMNAVWPWTSGIYSVLFSNNDVRDVTLTNGSTAATWSGGLSGAATQTANARYVQLMSPTAQATNFDIPFFDFSNSFPRFNLDDSRGGTYVVGSGAIIYYGSGYGYTSANLPSEQGGSQIDFSYNGNISSKAPKFFARVIFSQITTQNGMIGFDRNGTIGNSGNNYTTEHAAFLISGANLVASVADGTTQQKSSNLQGTYPITALHSYYIENVGGHYLFYIDGVLVFTSSANEPSNNIFFSKAALSASAVRTLAIYQHAISFNKV